MSRLDADDRRTIALGMDYADALIETLDHLLEAQPRAQHIAMVALMHALVRTEIKGRKPEVSDADHRETLIHLMRSVITMEERDAGR